MKRMLIAALAVVSVTAAAQAADLLVAEPAVVSAPAGLWDGFYVGGLAGFTQADFTDEIYDEYYGASGSGVTLGGTAGVNFHLNDSIVGGLEGDIAWDNASGVIEWDSTYSINWDASLRARIGLDMGAYLPYLTAGVAIADTQNAYSSIVDKVTATGWTAGLGLEAALSGSLSTKVEYRYSDYGTYDYSGYDIHLTTSTVRVGLNYHF